MTFACMKVIFRWGWGGGAHGLVTTNKIQVLGCFSVQFENTAAIIWVRPGREHAEDREMKSISCQSNAAHKQRWRDQDTHSLCLIK